MRGERKQSDSSVVVMKRANKEGELSAESVERRGVTNGNFGSPKYGPDPEPGCRDTGGGSDTAGVTTRCHHLK